MTHIRRELLLGFLIPFIVCITLSQYLYAQIAYTNNDTPEIYNGIRPHDQTLKMISLKDLLGRLHQQYQLRFVFNDQVIKGVELPASLLRKNSDQLIATLTKSLRVEGLKLSQIGAKQYGITSSLEKEGVISSGGSAKVIQKPDQVHITGSVKDDMGNPLVGVTIKVQGGSTGTVTDKNGKFTLDVAPTDSLVISYIGYNKQLKYVGNQTEFDIVLEANSTSLNQLVVVGYGTQKKATITGSISEVAGDQLTKAPVASITNTLAGRLPGLVSLQSSGQPGADAASLSIRGFGSPLVIVDGVESDFNEIDPNEIESITILKDGSASIYGSRAGNGVVLVTTKRGKVGKPTITLNTSYTLQGITVMPKPASSGQYAEMQREAWIQSGKAEDLAPFTEEQIEKYYEAADPYLYPNTDWYKVLFRDWAPQQQHNISVRGGSEKIKYYGFLGYLDQETMVKEGGGDFKRYNLRSNIDADILDNLSLHLDLSSIYQIRDFPWRGYNAGANTVWQDYWNTLPIYPATLPDPTKISYANGGGVGNAKVVTDKNISGYSNNISQNLKGTLSLDYSFESLLNGLRAKAFVNIDQDYSDSKSFQKPVNFYTYDPESDTYTLAGSFGTAAGLNQGSNRNRVITGQFSLNYDRDLGNYNHLTAMLLYELIDYRSSSLSAGRINFLSPAIDQMFAGSTDGMTNNGSANEMGRKSLIGRINYSYKEKYLAEAILRADASAKFPKSKRWGYFPSISLGWRISEENFLKDANFFDNLKLRMSYGQSGNDGVGNFQYLAGYQYGLTYILDNMIQQGITSTGLPNPNLTWEKINIYNVGIDFSFFNHKLYGSTNLFYRQLDGIPATRLNSLPASFGASLPPVNLNSQDNRGFDFQLGTSGKTGDLSWNLRGNISWSRAKWGHYEEPEYTDPDQKRINQKSGNWTDEQFGYISDGLFTSQKQINNLSFDQDNQGNVSLRPGDIRYVDVNKDGKLDWRDQVRIGKGTVPHWMLGVNINLRYKDFDLNTLFQGALGFYDYIVLRHGTLSPALVYEKRWTKENDDPNALIPRLGGASTNGLISDFYYKKANYVRLKSFSLGYNLPNYLLEKIGIKKVRIYVAGTNLLTFDALKKYKIDPEAPSGNAAYYYPQQRTITLGLNISL